MEKTVSEQLAERVTDEQKGELDAQFGPGATDAAIGALANNETGHTVIAPEHLAILQVLRQVLGI